MPHKDPEVRRAYQAAYAAAHREEQAAYYAAHREKKAAYAAARYVARHEEIAVQQAAYRAAHREVKAAYYATNREELVARQAAYNVTHREEIAAYKAAYAKANPAKMADIAATRRARKADAFIEAIDRQIVFARDAGTCGICQTAVAPEGWHLDHKQPLSKGGMHSYDNVQVSHPSCNLQKGTSYAEQS